MRSFHALYNSIAPHRLECLSTHVRLECDSSVRSCAEYWPSGDFERDCPTGKQLLRAMFSLLTFLFACRNCNRGQGRPFVAQNPETKAKPPVLQDERLQKAISELLLKPTTRSVM